MATLLDIRTRAAERMNDTGFTTNGTAFYNQSINDAQREMSESLKLLWKKTTSSSVSGTQSYTLPTDFVSVYGKNSLVYTDTNSAKHYPTEYPYKVITGRHDDLTDTTVTGTPQLYWVQGKSYYLYKTPDFSGASNLSLEHYYYADDLSGDSDISELPDNYKMALVYLTAAHVSERNELWAQGMNFRMKYYFPELNRVSNVSTDATTATNGAHGLSYMGS